MSKKSKFSISAVEIPQKRGIRAKHASYSKDGWSESLLPAGNKGAKVAENLNHHALGFILVSLALLFGLVGYHLFSLQIVNGSRYVGLAEGNRVRERVSYAQRGRILDRNGIELATNTATFQLSVTPYLMPKDEARRNAMYELLSAKTALTSSQIKEKAESQGAAYTQPLLIKDHLTYEKALAIEQKIPELTGFSLDEVPTRQYKPGLAQVLGYVGRVNEAELERNKGLLPVDFIGKDGIEAQYDSTLRGTNGLVRTEVDAAGKPVRTLNQQATQAGRDIHLTIDYNLQTQLVASLQEQMQKAGAKKASGVAMDPRTGEVLAMASLPSYDNNLFNSGISEEQYAQLVNNKLSPLQNKAISGSYPPGSIIKPMHIIGTLQEGIANENTTIVDNGKLVVQNVYDPNIQYVFAGWNLNGLGPMNARRAIAMSSDIYFYTVGGGYKNFKGLGVTKLTEYYRKFGLGRLTGIDLPGETDGRIPTPEWLKQTHNRDWTTGDTYNISIGQGDILVSPLQMTVGTAALLNGGKLMQPYIFAKSVDGQDVNKTKTLSTISANPYYFQVAREGMKQVIGGTTSVSTFANVPVPVAGKSGTAETDPNAKKKPHAWYTAFAPYDNPSVVFSVLLEEGEGGSQYAAPAIAKTMSWYFRSGQGQR